VKVALHDHENNGYPNLALMKLSAIGKERIGIGKHFGIVKYFYKKTPKPLDTTLTR